MPPTFHLSQSICVKILIVYNQCLRAALHLLQGFKIKIGGHQLNALIRNEVDSPEQTDAEDDTTRADDGLRIRALLKILTKPVERLIPSQRQIVKDIGLGRLLGLQITNLSRQMGLWLVENFDPRSCTLQLQNGQTIHITVDDVAAVLGLSKRHIEIIKRTTKALPEILKEWRWIFERTTAYITPKALTRKMIEVDAADLWFKRHFALLVMSVLIDPMMVINALINSKQVWMKSVNKLYGGPILFLKREEGEEVQVADDGALGDETAEAREGNKHKAHEGHTRSSPTSQCIKSPTKSPPKRQGKMPVVEYSPVRPRQRLSVIDVNAPINATEEAVREWVFENPHPDPAQELFKFESRVILWSYMLLLKPDTEIPTTIIDAWAAILNNNEEHRLLARLFSSIWTTLYTVVNPLGDEDERYKKFIDSYLVDKSFAMETRCIWHYYMIYFDPLYERFEVIDNSSSVCKTEDKYGTVPKRLFLSGLKSTYKANKIEKLKVKMMKMAWRDNRNKIDCGVFLMRHIETFRGQSPKLWNCGLQKEKKDQLNALRVKYLTALVMSDLNEHRAQNIQAAEFRLEGWL
nr:ulp1 protease family, C-terminal catalytic domain-containing protein [Ipomoea batatas]